MVQGSLPSGIRLTSINTPGGVSNIGSYEQQFMHPYQYQQIQLQFPLQQMQSINQTNRDLAIRQIQSQHPNPDPYGILGLLSVIRMSDCDLKLLALGIDLTNMGLDMNSSENVQETFASPCPNEPDKSEPEFTVPDCFNAKQLPP